MSFLANLYIEMSCQCLASLNPIYIYSWSGQQFFKNIHVLSLQLLKCNCICPGEFAPNKPIHPHSYIKTKLQNKLRLIKSKSLLCIIKSVKHICILQSRSILAHQAIMQHFCVFYSIQVQNTQISMEKQRKLEKVVLPIINSCLNHTLGKCPSQHGFHCLGQ